MPDEKRSSELPAPCPITVLKKAKKAPEDHPELRVAPSLLQWNEDGEIELY